MTTLGELASQPIEERFAALKPLLSSDASESIARAEAAGMARGHVDVERLLWAVAFNVSPPTSANQQSYTTRFSGDYSFKELASRLTKVENSQNGSMCLLDELVWSVASEQRHDWQPPRAVESIDLRHAKHALGRIVHRDYSKVERFVQKRFGSRAGPPSEVTAEAWSEAFIAWWSPQARQRFLGLSRISTAVCQCAFFIAAKKAKPTRHADGIDLETFADRLSVSTPQTHDGVFDAYEACLETLPPRQRLVVDLFIRRRLTPSKIASVLQTSRPNVSNLLSKGLQNLRNCMQSKSSDFVQPAETESANLG